MADDNYYSLAEEKTKTSSNKVYSMRLKAIFLGCANVGKTSLSQRIQLGNKYEFIESTPSTIGIDFLSIPFNIAGNNIKIEIWDTAGQERFRSLIPAYYKSSDLIFIVFDPDNEESINDLDYWFKSIENIENKDITYNTNIINKFNTYLLANKSDIWNTSEKFDRNEKLFKEIQEKYENKYVINKVSAKDGENIHTLFKKAISDAYYKKKSAMYRDIENKQKNNRNGIIKLNNLKTKINKCC